MTSIEDKPPEGHRGVWSPRRSPEPVPTPREVVPAGQKISDVVAGMEAEAQQMFLRMLREAGTQGSTVGALKYLSRQLEAVRARIDDLVRSLESGAVRAAEASCLDRP